MYMSNMIGVYVPTEVGKKYKSDSEEGRKELQRKIKALIAANYGLKINKSRVTIEES